MEELNKIKNYHSKLDLNLLSRERVRSSEDDHHMEFVDEINGVVFVNDSKSVRISATRNSLDAIETSVILIIGGNDSDNDYSMLAKQIKEKVVAIIYLGNNPKKILEHYSKHYMLFSMAKDINEAVQIGNIYGKSGDVVLFSPACLNQNEFDNYKVRGTAFKNAVKMIK